MRKNSVIVFSNIRILALMLCSILGAYSATTLAQSSSTTNEEMPVQTPNEQADIALEASSKTAPNSISQQPVLRLEDTIRGNKEQPQVLTIVPWQLPVHQRINENTQWQLQVNQLSSIERNAFLRNLAVVKEIKAAQEAITPTSHSKQDE
jgi:hypothetical protein